MKYIPLMIALLIPLSGCASVERQVVYEVQVEKCSNKFFNGENCRLLIRKYLSINKEDAFVKSDE